MKIELKIKGMHCGSCEKKIIDKIQNLKGVSSISVSHKEGNAIVHFNEIKITKKDIINEITRMGYATVDPENRSFLYNVFSKFKTREV